MSTLDINGQQRQIDADPSTPILWAPRDTLRLTGTKFGCGAAQCGYCRSGQIMSATAFLKSVPRGKQPIEAEIDSAMAGNICRCDTYARIRAAIADAAKTLA
jgi:isoquinoline 1-oxidoreductase subunit alpha